MLPFTVGALGCAALLGIGNGAVFQLVPRYFPEERATVTGLVGAMGGMGGFFPPLLLGVFLGQHRRDLAGIPAALGDGWFLWWLNHRVFVPRQEALEIHAARRTPGPSTASVPAHGQPLDRSAGGGHRRRFAQPAEFRSCAGHLYFRRNLRRLGSDLPLLGVVAEASYPGLLAAGMAAIVHEHGAIRSIGETACALRQSLVRPDIHPAKV